MKKGLKLNPSCPTIVFSTYDVGNHDLMKKGLKLNFF